MEAASSGGARQAYSSQDYLRMNLWGSVVFVAAFMMVVCLGLMNRRWTWIQSHSAKATSVMNETHALSAQLVRHFSPSWKVERYQFRGMRMKHSAMSIGFQDIRLDLPGGVRVLNGVSGKFEAGRMCAIMGPSGAGKTTFMHVLSGKAGAGKISGAVLVNGRPASPSKLQDLMGFVPQDDIVHHDLTVREQIQFSARLRGRASLTRRRIESITADVLNVMQIVDIQNCLVGSVERRGISGGQRKRVNIGLELAADPTLLFLDEPTSGLDATSSAAICMSLKSMCQLGMTSIMVIHQPRYSIFTLFDDVLLLGRGGETVYLGPSTGAKAYFESLGFEPATDENPADWLMDVLSGEVKSTHCQHLLPAALPTWWCEHCGNPASLDLEGQPIKPAACTGEAGTTAADEGRAVLTQAVLGHWNTMKVSLDACMDLAELRRLLMHSAGYEPSPEVVQELMRRMAGSAAAASRDQLVDYLCNLRGDIANDEVIKQGDLASGETSFCRGRPWAAGGAAASQSSGGSGGPCRRPSFRQQLHILIQRTLVQWWRKNQQRSLFMVALALGGLLLAVLDAFVVENTRWDAMTYLNLHSCLALLLSIFCLGVFSQDRLVFWRERSSGLNVLAYFSAKVLVNTLDVVIMTVLFVSVYYSIRQPLIPFVAFLAPFVLTAYVAAGWGYFISALVPPQHGPFVVSLIIFLACGLLGNPTSMYSFKENAAMNVLVSGVSITAWSGKLSFLVAYHFLEPVPGSIREAAMMKMFKEVFLKFESPGGELSVISPVYTAAGMLIAMGLVLRLMGCLCLRFLGRSRSV